MKVKEDAKEKGREDYIGAEAGRLREGIGDGRLLGSGAEATEETTHGFR